MFNINARWREFVSARGHRITGHTPRLFYATDEPTSGFDAASAAEIMAILRQLASDTGMIIITSVHQPSTRVFNSFDQVLPDNWLLPCPISAEGGGG